MKSKITRPMLAATLEDVNTLKFPVSCTPKLDGIRCLVVDGVPVSRKFKHIPNKFIFDTLSKIPQFGKNCTYDGEILCKGKTFNEIQSLVMSEEGEPDFEYHIFDFVHDADLDDPYVQRMQDLYSISHQLEKASSKVKFLFPVSVNTLKELKTLEKKYLDEGYEGIMIRSMDGPYKCNRSTLKEGYLLKLKRFKDSEAVVVGFEEKLSNKNKKEKNELGLSKRSSKKAGLVAANTLGALCVQDLKTKKFFSVGSGFDDELKKEIWTNQHKYVGKIVKYKYQEVGAKELPRFPVFLGFRDERDM